MRRTSHTGNARQHIALVRGIDRWLQRAGVVSAVTRSHIAVDLGDALAAMDAIRHHTRQMLRCNPATKRGADRALTHATGISVQAFNELLWHVRGLNRRWERELEQRLARRTKVKRRRHAAA